MINRIAGCIANEPALISVDWVSASVVFEFQPDGFCSGHFGYAYSADGAATPFTVNDHAASYAASDYRSWIAVNHGFGVAQMLFQFDRRSMRFHVEFGYDDGPSWRVTPANLDTIVSELRPRLNTPEPKSLMWLHSPNSPSSARLP